MFGDDFLCGQGHGHDFTLDTGFREILVMVTETSSLPLPEHVQPSLPCPFPFPRQWQLLLKSSARCESIGLVLAPLLGYSGFWN
jgi:hypothetical protein